MTISEKVAYLKGLAEGLNLDTEKSKEGKLISVMIGILEELAMSVEDLEENALNLGEEIDVLSDDLADVESIVYDEDEDDEDYDDDWFEVECPTCGETLVVDDKALADFMEQEAKLYLSHGINYGGSGFMRLNLACSRDVLAAALERLLAAAQRRGLV